MSKHQIRHLILFSSTLLLIYLISYPSHLRVNYLFDTGKGPYYLLWLITGMLVFIHGIQLIVPKNTQRAKDDDQMLIDTYKDSSMHLPEWLDKVFYIAICVQLLWFNYYGLLISWVIIAVIDLEYRYQAQRQQKNQKRHD